MHYVAHVFLVRILACPLGVRGARLLMLDVRASSGKPPTVEIRSPAEVAGFESDISLNPYVPTLLQEFALDAGMATATSNVAGYLRASKAMDDLRITLSVRVEHFLLIHEPTACSERSVGVEGFLQKRPSGLPCCGTASISHGKALFTAPGGIERAGSCDQRWMVDAGGGYVFDGGWELSGRRSASVQSFDCRRKMETQAC